MATGAIGIGDFSKLTADNAGLNDGVPRPEKVQHTRQPAGSNRYISRPKNLERPLRRDG